MMPEIYLKPKKGEVVIWTTPEGRTFADTVSLVGELNKYSYEGSYLRNIHLRGGCMVDQRMIVAVLPAGTIIDQCTFDSRGYRGYTRDRRYAPDRDHKDRSPDVVIAKKVRSKKTVTQVSKPH